ncbi:MAG: hypothetical protein C4576_23525 [Desulfobacteraceae bacterium]|nr:MAG: hypothetical protein C4576_23525 [Desulfobacteraceae bacterium]
MKGESSVSLLLISAFLWACLAWSGTLRAEEKKESPPPPPVIETPEQFIMKNRAAAEKKLSDLKAQARECGADLLLRQVTDTGKIIEELNVAPGTLRYYVSDLSAKQALDGIVAAMKKWMQGSERTFIKDLKLYNGNPGSGYLPPKVSALFPESAKDVDSDVLHAADADTAAILNLPSHCDPSVQAVLGTVYKQVGAGCCSDRKQLLDKDGNPTGTQCLGNYDQWLVTPLDPGYKHRGSVFTLPLQRLGREFYMLSMSGDQPTAAGINKMAVTIPTFVPKMEKRQCRIEAGGRVKIHEVEEAAGFQDGPSIQKEWRYMAIRFLGLAFPEFEGQNALDLFLPARIPIHHGGLYERFSTPEFVSNESLKPKLKIDTGRGIKYVDTAETGQRHLQHMNPFNISIRTTVQTKGGIFQAQGSNRIVRTADVGKGTIRWTVGKLDTDKRSITRDITANLVDVVPEATVGDGIISYGGSYKVFVSVKGPADMSRYRVRWHPDGELKFAAEATSFQQESEEYWVSRNTISAGKAADEKTSAASKFSFSAEIVNSAGSLLAYNATGTMRQPPAGDLVLFAAQGKESPHRVPDGETIDIFSGGRNSETAQVKFLPYVAADGGTSFRPFPEVYDTYEMYGVKTKVGIRSSNAYAVQVAAVADGFQALPGTSGSGSADIYAWVGRDINPAHTVLDNDKVTLSPPIAVTHNKVLLEAGRGKKEGELIYYLRTAGPADMSKYTATWAGNKGIDTQGSSFRKTQDGYVAEWASPVSESLMGVAIRKRDNVVFSYRSLTPKITPTQPDIKLTRTPAPLKVTVKTEKGEGSDKTPVIVSGLDETLAVEVLDDSMPVKAEIMDVHPEDMGVTFCRWSFLNGEGLTFKNDVTPVEVSGEDRQGTCRNTISGLSSGFNANAHVQVDLVTRLTLPGKPVVTNGGDQAVGIPAGYPRR